MTDFTALDPITGLTGHFVPSYLSQQLLCGRAEGAINVYVHVHRAGKSYAASS